MSETSDLVTNVVQLLVRKVRLALPFVAAVTFESATWVKWLAGCIYVFCIGALRYSYFVGRFTLSSLFVVSICSSFFCRLDNSERRMQDHS